MGYSLQFGWLYEALGAIASGAGMTVLLITVTTVIGTVISIAGRVPSNNAGSQR